MDTFRKSGSARAIATEAASLRWLAQAQVDGGAAVAELAGVGAGWLETRYLPSATPSREDAARFGRQLARTHAAGARWWAQAPPGMDPADLATANLPTPAAVEPTWRGFGEYYAEARVRPYIEQAAVLRPADAALLHKACDSLASGRHDHPQPGLCGEVARIHGDLWGGNVVWAHADGGAVGTLIDPCANGGHAETDLAELALFGSPHLEATLAGYDEVSPLADGWRERVPMHQLHMLVVHVVLFGGSYVRQALSVAKRLN